MITRKARITIDLETTCVIFYDSVAPTVND